MIEQFNENPSPLKQTNKIEMLDMLRLTYINSWLLIDLDDVIADFAEYMCELMNECGSQCTPNDYISYQFSDFHGLTHKDLCRLIANEEVYVNLQPKKGAIKALSELRLLGLGWQLSRPEARLEVLRHKLNTGWLVGEQSTTD